MLDKKCTRLINHHQSRLGSSCWNVVSAGSKSFVCSKPWLDQKNDTNLISCTPHYTRPNFLRWALHPDVEHGREETPRGWGLLRPRAPLCLCTGIHSSLGGQVITATLPCLSEKPLVRKVLLQYVGSMRCIASHVWKAKLTLIPPSFLLSFLVHILLNWAKTNRLQKQSEFPFVWVQLLCQRLPSILSSVSTPGIPTPFPLSFQQKNN